MVDLRPGGKASRPVRPRRDPQRRTTTYPSGKGLAAANRAARTTGEGNYPGLTTVRRSYSPLRGNWGDANGAGWNEQVPRRAGNRYSWRKCIDHSGRISSRVEWPRCGARVRKAAFVDECAGTLSIPVSRSRYREMAPGAPPRAAGRDPRRLRRVGTRRRAGDSVGGGRHVQPARQLDATDRRSCARVGARFAPAGIACDRCRGGRPGAAVPAPIRDLVRATTQVRADEWRSPSPCPALATRVIALAGMIATRAVSGIARAAALPSLGAAARDEATRSLTARRLPPMSLSQVDRGRRGLLPELRCAGRKPSARRGAPRSRSRSLPA